MRLSQPETACRVVPYADPEQEVWWTGLRTLYAGLAFRQDTHVPNKLSKRTKYAVDTVNIFKQMMLQAAGNMNAIQVQIL